MFISLPLFAGSSRIYCMQPNCYTAGYLLAPNSGSVYESTKKEDQKLIRLEKLAEKLLPSIFTRSKLLYHDSLIFHS